MLRRIAGNLYWLGRYPEQAEGRALLLDGGLHEYLLAVQADCAALGDEVFNSYCKSE